MSELTCINFQITDRIAHIELARPPLNVLTMTALTEIGQVLESTINTPGVCAVLFTATPEARAFCAGVEITEYRGTTAYQTLMAFHDLFRLLDEMGKPVVVAVNGTALGGGCDLAVFADIVIASEQATFALPEVRVGLFPTLASVLLPQMIGAKRAAHMILTGAQINAQTAANWGLVSHLVTAEQMTAKIEEVLQSLRLLSAASLGMARRALHSNTVLNVGEALQRVEKLYLEQLMSLEDATEGVTALVEKRRPEWKDR